MNIVIVGAGNVGYYLTKALLDNNEHDIRIIEMNYSRCIYTADRLQVPVIHGDGTQISTLEKANIRKADILVALTGNDEDNFIAAQLTKEYFKIKTIIAKSNNPKNLESIKTVANIVISSANIITKIIEQEVDAINMKLVTRMNMGDASIVEFSLNEKNNVNNKTLSDINLPNDCLVVAIVRDGHSIIPSGDTTLMVGDDVMIFTREKNKSKLKSIFGKK